MFAGRKAIKLKIRREFTAFRADSAAFANPFCERIMGAYALMSMNFTPKEMLLLAFAVPEAPQAGAGMTSIVNMESTARSSSFLLNILNNVVNRVMVAADGHYSYADEVYISNVLRRLGVADVNQFVREVRTANRETKNLYHLQRLCETHGGILLHMPPPEPEGAPQAGAGETAAGAVPGAEGAAGAREPALHRSIIERLQTADVFRFVREFAETRSESRMERISDLSSAAYALMMNRYDVQEKRISLYGPGALNLHHHRNVFETGEALPPQGAEAAVLGQTVAAVLLDIMENAFSMQYEHALPNVSVRVELHELLSASAGRTLERMRVWQRETGLRTQQALRVFERRLSALDRREERVWERFASSVLAHADAAARITDTEQIRTEFHETERGESRILSAFRRFERAIQKVVRERREIETVTRKAAAMRGDAFFALLSSVYEGAPQGESAARTAERTLRLLSERVLRTEGGGEDEAISPAERHFLSVLAQEGGGGAFGETPVLPMPQESRPDTPEAAAGTDAIAEIAEALREYLPKPPLQRPGAAAGAERLLAAGEAADVPQAEGAGQAADAEGAPLQRRDLKETLDEYDRRNKEAAQRITERALRVRDGSGDGPAGGSGRGPEAGAPDEADILIRNLIEEARVRGRDLPLPPELILLLAEAEPQRREVYEKALLYIRDPERAQEEEKIRRLSIPEFNTEAERVRDRAQAEMQHLEAEERTVRETILKETERTIERTQQGAMAKHARPAAPWPAGPAPRFHRQSDPWGEPPGASAEAAAAEAAPRMEQEVHRQETVVREAFSETEVNRVVRETQARSAEEIADLLNHALSQQIGAISSRVYTQVERRLRLERARRGK
ncbi:MAG: hypothetical protein LBS91_02365 [Clostridiales Family XIII bacterium]|jgi:hypothetical protein|nr:hypothetical protein [Clostridiales Family XIII bacterium]